MITWDYVAGFVDGEGSISLSAHGRSLDASRQYYRARLGISNNHRAVLAAIRRFMGTGRLYVHTHGKHRDERRSANWRTSYILYVDGPPLQRVLEELLPRLVVKRAQAQVALAYIARQQKRQTRRYVKADYALVKKMQALNARAPTKGRPMLPVPLMS